MDARIRDLQRAARQGDTGAREQLWQAAHRLGTFGPGRVIGGAREQGTVDPAAGYRDVLSGMAFLGDVAARRAQAELPYRSRPIPTKLTQHMLIFSFGTTGTSALACALVRYAFEHWSPEIAADRSLPNRNRSIRYVLDTLEAAEAMVPQAVETLARMDERAGLAWGGIAGRTYMPGSPGLPGLPDFAGSPLGDRLLQVAGALSEVGLMGRWSSGETWSLPQAIWREVARTEAVRRLERTRTKCAAVAAANRELKAYCLARLAPLMSLGIVP